MKTEQQIMDRITSLERLHDRRLDKPEDSADQRIANKHIRMYFNSEIRGLVWVLGESFRGSHGGSSND